MIHFPRQRPHNASPEELKKFEQEKLKWWCDNKPVSAWPWSVLRQFQIQHFILQSGARELQNWRIQQFLAGEPTLFSFKKKIHLGHNKTLPTFTLLKGESVTPQDSTCFLIIPKDVIWTHILVYLQDDPVALFALMLSCRTLQPMCHKLLFDMAQRRFGPLGTPRAVMCAAFYEGSLPRGRVKRRKKTQGEEEDDGMSRNRLKEKLNLIARDFKSLHVVSSDVDSLIKASIEKNGCIDNLSVIWDANAKQVDARKRENAFIQTKLQTRVAEINTCLEQKGYIGLKFSIDNDQKITWENPCILPILSIYESNNEYSARRFLKNVEDYVYMSTEASAERVTAFVKFVEPILFNTAFIGMGGSCNEPFFPLLYLVVQMLLEIRLRGYVFYDRVITENEWLSKLAYLFSKEFQLLHQPDEFKGPGAYVCLWSGSDSRIRIMWMRHQEENPTLLHYYQWLRPWDAAYHLRLASPSTGQCYGYIPGYYLQPAVKSFMAHCLITKKKDI